MNIVITSGGTSEYIDKVRKITNSGTGKLGATIAEAIGTKHNIIYICTPKAVRPNIKNVEIIEIVNTNDLKEAVEKVLTTRKIDYFIHSMAVSDYYVDFVSTAKMIADELNGKDNLEDALRNLSNVLDNSNKLSSSEDNLVIMLKQTPKVIGLIKKLSPDTKLIGFKLLEGVEKEYLFDIARKLRDKNDCDYVVANDLKDIKEGNHKAFLINKNDDILEMNGKENIAQEIAKIVNAK